MALYTQYDIDLRIALLGDYIGDYAHYLMKAMERGTNIDCELSNLYFLIEVGEIASCYEIIAEEDDEQCCLTEAQMDHLFQQAQCISGICFPPKGLAEPAETLTCFISPETSVNDIILLEDGSGLLQEVCI